LLWFTLFFALIIFRSFLTGAQLATRNRSGLWRFSLRLFNFFIKIFLRLRLIQFLLVVFVILLSVLVIRVFVLPVGLAAIRWLFLLLAALSFVIVNLSFVFSRLIAQVIALVRSLTIDFTIESWWRIIRLVVSLIALFFVIFRTIIVSFIIVIMIILISLLVSISLVIGIIFFGLINHAASVLLLLLFRRSKVVVGSLSLSGYLFCNLICSFLPRCLIFTTCKI